jgi:hypothetical protein
MLEVSFKRFHITLNNSANGMSRNVLFYGMFHGRSDKGEMFCKTKLGQLPEPTTEIVSKAAF